VKKIMKLWKALMVVVLAVGVTAKKTEAATVKKRSKKDHIKLVDHNYGLETGRASFLSSV
jgi:hypothetical protein